jgi:hypothetical protein
MKIYVGNCQEKFDCNELLAQLSDHVVEPVHGFMKFNPNDLFYEDYINQTKMLEESGYNESTVEYRHYKSGTHFSEKYTNMISEIVKVTPLMCWISEIQPGKCTPWHWDMNPWENEHKKLGNLVRYFCFLSKPQPGHIFVTEHDAYYNEPQGAIYQYADIHSWHAGSNVGLTPKYLLTLTGVQ